MIYLYKCVLGLEQAAPTISQSTRGKWNGAKKKKLLHYQSYTRSKLYSINIAFPMFAPAIALG